MNSIVGWFQCIPRSVTSILFSKKAPGLLTIADGGVLGIEYHRGDRVVVIGKGQYQGKYGRIYFIHDHEDIYIHFERDSLEEYEAELSDSMKLCDISLVPTLFSGYVHRYYDSAFHGGWRKVYIEVWDNFFCSRNDDKTFEYEDHILFGEYNCKIIDPIPGASYPFGNSFPPKCMHVQSQMTSLQYNDDIIYFVTDDERELSSLKMALTRGIRSASLAF